VSQDDTTIVMALIYTGCSSYAPADLFVLLSWCCGIYAICVKENGQFSSTSSFKALVGSIALLLDMVLESSKAKETLKKGALTRTRRALRSVSATIPSFFGRAHQIMQSDSAILTVISNLVALVKSNASQNPIRFIPLIGVTVAVLVRLKYVTVPSDERLPKELQVSSNRSNSLFTHLRNACKVDVTTTYTSIILTSRIPIPFHVLVCLMTAISTGDKSC